MQLVYALEFPEISEILVWPDFFASFNKVALINTLALVLAVAFYWVASSRDPMVAPKGTAAQLGFYIVFVPVTISAKVRNSDYGLTTAAFNAQDARRGHREPGGIRERCHEREDRPPPGRNQKMERPPADRQP